MSERFVKRWGTHEFVSIPKPLFDFLQTVVLKNNDRAVFDFIISKAVSYDNKLWERIAISQIAESTRINKANVSRCLKRLISMGLVLARDVGRVDGKYYDREYAIPSIPELEKCRYSPMGRSQWLQQNEESTVILEGVNGDNSRSQRIQRKISTVTTESSQRLRTHINKSPRFIRKGNLEKEEEPKTESQASPDSASDKEKEISPETKTKLAALLEELKKGDDEA